MNNQRKFPCWIHLVLGLLWIAVGVTFHDGWELAIWVAGGLVMITIGVLNREIKTKKEEKKEIRPAKEIKEEIFKFESDPLEKLICTQEFGKRPEYYKNYGSPGGHNGLDFRTWVSNNPDQWEQNVFAVLPGKVLEAREDGVYGKGKYVRLDHGDWGQSVYLHLSSINVSEGQKIEAGKTIGVSGKSGPPGTEPHLHFSYKPKGFDRNNGFMGCVDPVEYFVGEITYV